MRNALYVAIVLGVVVVLTLAAVPQGGEQSRDAVKLGDRVNPWVGQRFFASRDDPYVHRDDRGDWKLVRVGVDFVELESDSAVLLIPLAALQVRVRKPQ